MPQIRQYPQATIVNLTDAVVLDQLGIGTRWCTVAQLLALVGAGPYDVAMGYSQPPPPNSTFLTFITPRAFTLPVGLVGSVAEFVSGPTSALVLTVQRNGEAIGTISFPQVANGGSVGVFAAATETAFSPGDLLEIASGPALFGAANLAVTFEAALTT